MGLLEEYLGVALFQRLPRHVALTREGQAYLPSIRSAFEMIGKATAEMKPDCNRADILQINVLPSLSSRWLIPLLEGFRHRYPRIGVNVRAGDGAIDFEATRADVAIRVAKKNIWKQHHAEKIISEELLPVCSPALISGKRAVRRPEDMLRHPLMQHIKRPLMWQEYMQAIGHGHLEIRHTLALERFFMLIEAAVDGMGIALVPRFLIETELKERRLVIAFEAPYKSPYGYYLICRRHALKLRKIELFREWVRISVVNNANGAA